MGSDKDGATPRSAVFVVRFVKLLRWPLLASMVVIWLSIFRLRGLAWWQPCCGDYWLGGLSGVTLGVFVWLATKAWLDSATAERKVDNGGLARYVAEMTALLLFVAINFGVAYSALLKFLYLKMESRGQFGDSFGALNSLVSTIALIGLWITIWLQHRQMAIDREQNRQEMLERRKADWPVVLVPRVLGTLKLWGLSDKGTPLFNFRIRLTIKNCSRTPILGVMANVKLEQKEGVSDTNTLSYPYLERNRAVEPCVDMTDTSADSIGVLSDLCLLTGRSLEISTAFSTVQGLSYANLQQFVLKPCDTEENHRLLNAWRLAVEAAARVTKAKGDLVSAQRSAFEACLQSNSISLNETVKLQFEYLQTGKGMEEISPEKYQAQIDRCRHFVSAGKE